MRKKMLLSTVIVLCILTAGITGYAFGSGSIQLVINGNTVKTDVAPQSVNGRVLVPISTIANELHTKVLWDADNQSVIVNPDELKSEADINRSMWVDARNKIVQYFIAYDDRDQEAALSLLDEKFTSNRFNLTELIPVGGLTANIVDYHFKDVAYTKSKYVVRVQVVTKNAQDDLKIADWDFILSGAHPSNGKITSINVVNGTERALDTYTVFPGLTIDKMDYSK